MVTAMHLAVAVGTVLTDKETVSPRITRIIIEEVADMVCPPDTSLRDVTLLAKFGPRLIQQRHVIRTMHSMTQGAFFTGGLVLPQEWPAFLGVTAIAVLVDGELFY